MKAIINGKIYKDNKFYDNMVLLFDETIKDIITIEDFKKIGQSDIETFDAMGDYVLPGFIDQHIHGFEGFDVMDSTLDSIVSLKKALVKNGVTTFLPTTLTASLEKLDKVCEVVREGKKLKGGAKILGIHLEGPFINPLKKGAQNEEYIISSNDEFLERNKDIIKSVTIAPEYEMSLKTIDKFKDTINFQIGHTNGTYKECCEGIAKGAKGFTHTFNAMTPIHHRDLGAVGACMLSDTYAELICDNIHLDEEVYNFVLKNKGMEKILLITDCMEAGGLPDGKYSLGGLDVYLKDNACRLSDGVLAGSVLKLNLGLKNFCKGTKSDLEDSIKTVTLNQSIYFGEDTKIGKLETGFSSDIIFMDKDFNVKKNFVMGECEYEI